MLNIQKYISCFDNVEQANVYLRSNFKLDVIDDTILSDVDGSWYNVYIYVPRPSADLADPIVQEANCLILDEDGELIAKAANIARSVASVEQLPQSIVLENARVIERCEGVLLVIYNLEGEWFVGSQFSADARETPFGKKGFLSYGSQFKTHLLNIRGQQAEWYDFFINVDPRLCFSFLFRLPKSSGLLPTVSYDIKLLDIINTADGRSLSQERVDKIAASWCISRPPYRVGRDVDSLQVAVRSMPLFRAGITIIDKNDVRIDIDNPIFNALRNAKEARGRITPVHIAKIFNSCRDNVDLKQIERAFPEYKPILEITEAVTEELFGELITLWNHAKRYTDDKSFAREVMHHPLNYLLFMFRNGKINSLRDAVMELEPNKLVEQAVRKYDKELQLAARILRVENGGGNEGI